MPPFFDPRFPDVPVFPGVPPVRRLGGLEDELPPLTSDSASITAEASQAWGIYDSNGTIVLRPDNISSFEFQREYRLADYPMEQGAFETYNKVITPYEARVTMTRGGTREDRKQFLGTVDALAADMNLYNIVTPEETYVNANVSHYSYHRTAVGGAGLLVVEMTIQEVRVTTAPQFSKSQSPSGADAINGGSVQANPDTGYDPSITGDGSDLGKVPQ